MLMDELSQTNTGTSTPIGNTTLPCFLAISPASVTMSRPFSSSPGKAKNTSKEEFKAK